MLRQLAPIPAMSGIGNDPGYLFSFEKDTETTKDYNTKC